MLGKIKVLKINGYGFITSDQGKDIFFHASRLREGQDYNELKEGNIVSFEMEIGPRGPQAIDISVVNDTSAAN